MRRAVLCLLLLGAACVRPRVGPAPSFATWSDAGGAQAVPVRRLARDEIENTIVDLLGPASRPRVLPPDDQAGHSGFPLPAAVTPLDLRAIAQAAQQAADAAPRLCRQDGCARAFIADFTRRAFRRTPSAGELTALTALYDDARTRAGQGPDEAQRLVIATTLQSPGFLYHWELRDGRGPGAEALAARLSYMLWAGPPDEALAEAARRGHLATAAGIEAQTRRMLRDRRARRGLGRFHLQWLDLRMATVQKDPRVYPSWGASLRRAMEEEVIALADHVYRHGDGKLETLLTAPLGFVSASLGWVYQVADPDGAGPERRALDPARRAGLLTTAAFLARHGNTHESHPVRRGQIILERVLCEVPKPPPANIPQIKPQSPDLTTRERYAEHTSDPFCASCHENFDPLGFAFEHYDGIGAYRATDGAKPVDASGAFMFPGGGAEHPFKDAVELVRILARSRDAARCMALQWTRYALGRHEGEADAPALDAIHRAFARSGGDLRALLVAITTSPLFRS